jgi:hypothetical protein
MEAAAHQVPEDAFAAYVLGYTCAHDVTADDWRADGPWVRAGGRYWRSVVAHQAGRGPHRHGSAADDPIVERGGGGQRLFAGGPLLPDLDPVRRIPVRPG